MLEESGNCMERGEGKRKKRNFNTENRDGGSKPWFKIRDACSHDRARQVTVLRPAGGEQWRHCARRIDEEGAETLGFPSTTGSIPRLDHGKGRVPPR